MQFGALSVVVLAIELNAIGSSGLITDAPLNTVTDVGQQAIFNCTSNIPNQQNWVFSADRDDVLTSSAQNIAISCVVQSGFTADYEVVRLGGSSNKCSLIVKATTLQQAGVYTCSDTAAGPSAALTVTDRHTSIVVSATSGVVAGDEVTMSYTVIYNTSTASSLTPTIQPVLTWTDSDGNIVSSSNTTGTNSITSSISVTAERQTIRPYTCGISYKINWSSPSTSFATNIPDDVSTPPQTPDIDVSYEPQIQFIGLRRSDETHLCPGDTVTLTCYATANPPANYSWIGPDSRNYTGSTIPADMNGDYNCTASNVIRGSLRSETIKTTVIASGIGHNSCEGSKTEDPSNIGQRTDEVHNRNEVEEMSFPEVYQELSQTRQQPSIYAQLEN